MNVKERIDFSRQKGLTLVEILVALVISLLTLGALFEAYMSLLTTHKQQIKTAETNMQVLMALEFLRKDIELAGFGLPRDATFSLSYNEAVSTSECSPDVFNSNNMDFKPLDLGNNYCNNADYLVIRSSLANLDKTSARKWGYAYYNNDISNWEAVPLSDDNFTSSDRCISLNLQRQLTNWNFTCEYFSGNATSEIYYLFGINDNLLRMPFNRVDYFLKRPDFHPQKCEPSTYELYRAEINHSNGNRNEQPILDCVLNFQVIVGLDTNNDGKIDTWSKDLTSLSGEETFDQIKEINVYLVYQEGQKSKREVFDKNTIQINYPDGTNESISVPSRLYRWKLIQFRVKTLNLQEMNL